MTTQLRQLSIADRIIISGHLLGAASMICLTIGALLRTPAEIPVAPLFTTPPPLMPSHRNTSGYWDL